MSSARVSNSGRPTTPEWLPAEVDARVPVLERARALVATTRVRFAAAVAAVQQRPLPDWMATLLTRARQ